MRRAKIVCTLGPAVRPPERLRELVDAGMDVARLNLSHGAYADHEAVYRAVRAASDEAGHAVGILVDLQGPKIRLGPVRRRPGRRSPRRRRSPSPPRTSRATRTLRRTTYKGLPGDVRPGDRS